MNRFQRQIRKQGRDKRKVPRPFRRKRLGSMGKTGKQKEKK